MFGNRWPERDKSDTILFMGTTTRRNAWIMLPNSLIVPIILSAIFDRWFIPYGAWRLASCGAGSSLLETFSRHDRRTWTLSTPSKPFSEPNFIFFSLSKTKLNCNWKELCLLNYCFWGEKKRNVIRNCTAVARHKSGSWESMPSLRGVQVEDTGRQVFV